MRALLRARRSLWLTQARPFGLLSSMNTRNWTTLLSLSALTFALTTACSDDAGDTDGGGGESATGGGTSTGGATDGGSEGGDNGGGTTLCDDYCTTWFAKDCNAAPQVTGPNDYADEAACLSSCATFSTNGKPGDAGGNTVHCRIHHLGLAGDPPDLHCGHAALNPTGSYLDI